MACSLENITSTLQVATKTLNHIAFAQIGGTLSFVIFGGLLIAFFYQMIRLKLNQISGGEFLHTLSHEMAWCFLLGTFLGMDGPVMGGQSTFELIQALTEFGPWLAHKILTSAEYDTSSSGLAVVVCAVESSFRDKIFGSLGNVLSDVDLFDSLQVLIATWGLAIVFIGLVVIMVLTVFGAYMRMVGGILLLPITGIFGVFAQTRNLFFNNLRVILEGSIRLFLCMTYIAIVLEMLEAVYSYFQAGPKAGVANLLSAGYMEAMIIGVLMLFTYTGLVAVSGEVLNVIGASTNASTSGLASKAIRLMILKR